MIAKLKHLSCAVANPRRAADALAKLTQGQVEPFHPLPGAFVCLWGGWENQFVELYPKGKGIVPGDGDDGGDFADVDSFTRGSVHLNLDTEVSAEEIKKIAAEFGYRYCYRPKSGGPLHEVWLENELLVELVSPELR